MGIMELSQFKSIFNEAIFERSKPGLLKKISKHPNRYIGLFRPTKAKAKIMQNLLQSHEIKFGDAFEILIRQYLQIIGCNMLDNRFIAQDGKNLSIDQCFCNDGITYFIEQKVRDDHDSTKKRGQIENFEKKLYAMQKKYSGKEIIGIVYFIDPEFKKNKNYYHEKLNKIQEDYGVDTYIFYGRELFDFLNLSDIWDEILKYLEIWKQEIPDLPELNFDVDAQQTFEEIKDLEPLIYRKLLNNADIVEEIFPILFPQKKTLKLLQDHFGNQPETIYRTLHDQISRIL